MKYAVISPVLNEEAYIRHTLESVCGQTHLPGIWIIADDGSSDSTPAIISEFTAKYKWIEVIRTENRAEERSGGAKVVNAFFRGYKLLLEKKIQWDFIVKLDGDLSLPPDYFERIAEEFSGNEKIGLCGGYLVNLIDGKLVREIQNDYHIRGAFKSVRRKCFEDIGGFKSIWNWDGVDELEAIYKGWLTKTVEVPVVHFRPTTSSYNIKKHSFKSGIEAYREGNSIFLVLLRGIKLAMKPPIFLNCFLYIAGFFSGFIKRDEKYFDKDFSRFINRFHFKRILRKVARAGRN